MQTKYSWFIIVLFSLLISFNCNAADEQTDADACPSCSSTEKQIMDESKSEPSQTNAPKTESDSTDDSKGDEDVSSSDSVDES